MAALLAVLFGGCGTTTTRTATEQLLVSDAVDGTVAQLDFSALTGESVFFDTTYVRTIKGVGFVNGDYIISALRQQMVAAGCLLQDNANEADFVVEARVGALGTDGHEITYGIPASSGLTNAASLLPNAPAIPAIPEISIAKKNDYRGTTKIAVFAYHRETKQPVWQSGIATSTSDAKDAWVLGAGPFQFGTIYDRTRFAGEDLRVPLLGDDESPANTSPAVSYYHPLNFRAIAKKRAADQKKQNEAIASEMEQLADLPTLPFTFASQSQPPSDTATSTAPAKTSTDGASDPVAEKPSDTTTR